MSAKRKRDDGDTEPAERKRDTKKVKGGFKVGPDNLPDGTWRRKTQKIKSGLVERAKIKKDFAKLKRKGNVPDEPEKLPQPASMALDKEDDADENADEDDHEASNAPHPARQALIAEEEIAPQPTSAREQNIVDRRKRKPKTTPFKKEAEQAQRRKAEAEERQRAREDAERQRKEKIEERERFRRAMAKARTGGPNGQRKLGRESKVLLERVRKMVGDGGG